MTRAVLFAVLLSAYGAFAGRQYAPERSARMDVVSPRAREIEQALAARRFAVALPIVLELRNAYPNEPLVELWLAAVSRGLDRPHEEAQAWERFVAIGAAPAEACPGLPDAYARARSTLALSTYRRCVDWDPSEPERLIDLANALERDGQHAEALDVWRRAARLDPAHPVVVRRLESSSKKGAQR